ncbi:MAG: OmpA family protein [Planktomarina sp.]
MFWINKTGHRFATCVAVVLLITGLTGCTQDVPFIPEQSKSLDGLSFASPKALTLADHSSARMIVARRFAQEVPTTVTFPSGSSDLTQETETALALQAKFMQAYPELTFFVVGHTDDTGTATENAILARKRAQTVAAFLIAMGVPHRQMTQAIALADQDPRFALNGATDRRAVTEVAHFVTSDIPTHTDLSSRPL